MYDTIIIGAGIAGLSAGNYLNKKENNNFIVLESSEKVGGRIQTIEFDGKLFSIGPGWIHGRKGNPIYDIFTELQIPIELTQTVESDILFVWDTVSCRDITELYIEKRNKLKLIIEEISDKFSDSEIDPEKSFKDIISENSEFYNSITDIDRTVLYTCLEIYLGAPLNETSGLVELYYNEIYDYDEGIVNFRINDPLGGLKFIDYLCKDFQNQIKLNHKVKSIEWSAKSESVKVIIDNGDEFIGKNVIITVQSDLLAKQSIKFNPELPIEKISAWKHVPSVNYCRLFAKFPKQFWPDKEWLIQIVKDVDPLNELILWQNASSQNLCSENDNILICHFTNGSKRGRSRFDVDKETLIEIVAETMKNMFPHTYCKPTDAKFVTFSNNERFSGSFSIASPGIDKIHIEQLKKSVGPLHFAGESVVIELIGTMQSAYLSGKVAAKHCLSSN